VAQGKFNGKVRTLYNKHLAAELGSTFVMYNSHGDNEITYFELCFTDKTLEFDVDDDDDQKYYCRVAPPRTNYLIGIGMLPNASESVAH
jgi:hypothetical protein